MSTDPNSPTVLVSVETDIEAAAIVAALGARGVDASTTGGFTAGFRAEAPGEVHVVVRLSDLEVAQKTLAELDDHRGDVDWSQVDVGSPDEID